MVDLADIVGRSRAGSLVDRVAAATGPEVRSRAVEAFLEGLFRRHEPDVLAAECARRINETWGTESVDDLVQELGVSGRHLRRRFTRAVGIGPKRFSRLVRAQKALGALRRGWSWSEVALRCRYVDQAHLTREIKAFTGRTPGRLGGSGRETGLMRSFNARRLSSFFSTVYP